MTSRSLKYAEETLGVHACYQRAEGYRTSLDGTVSELDKAQDRKRILADLIADREMDLLIEERGKHATMSGAELERHMKIVKHQDSTLRGWRAELLGVSGQISGLEYDADMLRVSIKIEVARMEELGGYLKFLAAIKQAELTQKSGEQQ